LGIVDFGIGLLMLLGAGDEGVAVTVTTEPIANEPISAVAARNRYMIRESPSC
jgi:hypothetical protein